MSSFESFPLRFERQLDPLEFRSREQEVVPVRPVRVMSQLGVYLEGKCVKTIECLIDTGAPISVFPHSTWSEHWFRPLEPDNVLAKRATRVKGVPDDSEVQAQIGHIDISLSYVSSDWTPNVIETPTFTILAKFANEKSSFNRVVLGMEAMERWDALEVNFGDSTARLIGAVGR